MRVVMLVLPVHSARRSEVPVPPTIRRRWRGVLVVLRHGWSGILRGLLLLFEEEEDQEAD